MRMGSSLVQILNIIDLFKLNIESISNQFPEVQQKRGQQTQNKDEKNYTGKLQTIPFCFWATVVGDHQNPIHTAQ